MINLINITSKVYAVTSSVADITVSASWMDYNGTIVTPGGALLAPITSATNTDLVPSPGASTTRNVKGLILSNTHATLPNTVTIKHTDGTNTAELWSGVLAANEQIEYVDGAGFVKYNSNGVANGGTNGTNGVNGTTLFTGSSLLDFGSGNDTASVVINDANITPSSNVVVSNYFNSSLSLGRDVEETLIDPISLIAVPGSGNLTVYGSALEGTVVGKYGVSYVSS